MSTHGDGAEQACAGRPPKCLRQASSEDSYRDPRQLKERRAGIIATPTRKECPSGVVRLWQPSHTNICFALAVNLLGAGGQGTGIVAAPARLAICLATVVDIDCGAIEDRLVPGLIFGRHLCTQQRSASANAFDINRGFLLGHARLREGTDDAACSRTGRSEE